MLRKPWYLIPVIAVACMLTACSVQETVTAPTEVTAVLAEPTEPTQSTATEPVEEVRAQAPADEVPAETEPAHPPR